MKHVLELRSSWSDVAETFEEGGRRATAEISGYCPRCADDVRTVRPWPHWKKVRYGFFGVLAMAALFSPVILADGCMLIPSIFLFISALGPLNTLAAEEPTCARCGGVAAGAPRGAVGSIGATDGESA